MEEEKASGIEVEPQSELDQLLQNLIEEEEEAVESVTEVGTTKRRKIEEDKQKAEDIRMKALEKIGETKKRKGESAEGDSMQQKKIRRGSKDTIEFLKEKSDREFAVREKELEMKKVEQEQSSQRMNQLMQQQSQMLLMMQQQMKQQSDLMMSLMKKFQ